MLGRDNKAYLKAKGGRLQTPQVTLSLQIPGGPHPAARAQGRGRCQENRGPGQPSRVRILRRSLEGKMFAVIVCKNAGRKARMDACRHCRTNLLPPPAVGGPAPGLLSSPQFLWGRSLCAKGGAEAVSFRRGKDLHTASRKGTMSHMPPQTSSKVPSRRAPHTAPQPYPVTV